MDAPFPLDDMQIASPCTADWAQMTGDERARFCGACKKHVYNLSAMTRAQAVRTIVEKEGRFCARVYRRADGTVLTADCPRGLADVAARLHIAAQGRRGLARWLYAGAASALVLIAGVSVFGDNIRRALQPSMGGLAVGALAKTPSPTAHSHQMGLTTFNSAGPK